MRLGSVVYRALPALCEENRCAWAWDPYLLMATVRTGQGELRMTVESRRALADDRWMELSAPVVLRQGVVWVPEDVAARLSPPPVTPEVPPTVAAPGRNRLRTIVIDAGHGGKDPGAIGRHGLREKSVTLDIARRLATILQRHGVRSVLTRADDRFVPLAQRVRLANAAGADCFVSIHANSSRSRSVSGFEVYYLSEAIDDTARAAEAARAAPFPYAAGTADSPTPTLDAILWDLAQTAHRVEAMRLGQQLSAEARRMGLHSRGIKGARFVVLKGTWMPAVLVEISFLSNAREEALLRKPTYRQQVARLVAEGLLAYKAEYERTNGFSR